MKYVHENVQNKKHSRRFNTPWTLKENSSGVFVINYSYPALWAYTELRGKCSRNNFDPCKLSSIKAFHNLFTKWPQLLCEKSMNMQNSAKCRHIKHEARLVSVDWIYLNPGLSSFVSSQLCCTLLLCTLLYSYIVYNQNTHWVTDLFQTL